MKNVVIEIASLPDRENLVAEIWIENKMIAEINQENINLEIIIFVDEDGKLTLDYDEFLEALEKARKKLIGR